MPRHLLIPVLVILSCALPTSADEQAMGPRAFLNRSLRPDLSYLILSRRTGRIYPSLAGPADSSEANRPGLTAREAIALPEPKPLTSRERSGPSRLPPLKLLDFGIMDQLKKYERHIEQYSKMNNLDPNLTRAVIYVESAGDPLAVSGRGAQGLMQLMPGTASEMGVSNPMDPAQNIFGGTRYIRSMLNRFGSVDLALWAYNAGPEAVKRRRLPGETRNYIPRVIRIKKILDAGGA